MNAPVFQPRTRQRGVVLIFCLIALVILLAGGVVVMRSMNSTLFSAGNMAFRRDLLNQGEQAVAKVLAAMKTGGALAASSITDADRKALNYKASQLATNAQGIPVAMLGADSVFETVGTPGNDLEGATGDVKIRYLIDRLCSAAGPVLTSQCVMAEDGAPEETTIGTGGPAEKGSKQSAVYRVTVRVTGPRDTQVFLQTSLTKPD
jgi:type IV pilus assembly protein PilX